MNIAKFPSLLIKFMETDLLKNRTMRTIQEKMRKHTIICITGSNDEIGKSRDELHTLLDIVMDSMVSDGVVLREMVPDKEELREMLRTMGV